MTETGKMPEQRTIVQRALNKVMQHYWRRSRGLSLGVRALLFDQQAQILLIRRRNDTPDCWSLPGGDVCNGEAVADAAARHLLNQAQIAIIQPPQLAGILANFSARPSEHLALLVVREWRYRDAAGSASHSPNTPPWRFFATEALPDNISASCRARIEEYLANEPPAQHW